MAKFNLNQILSDASKAAASGKGPLPRPAESRFEKISVFDLVPSEDNFYSMLEIDELKAAIEIAGKVLQNLVVVPLADGKYKVISGHRRRLASLALAEEGKPQFEFVPCDIEPNEEAAEDQEVRDGLMLIVTNSQREKTAWDKVEEVRFLREVLEKARTKPRFVAVLQNIVATAFGGAEVQADGTRDFIAKVLHTSTTQIGRYDAIIRNLCPAFKAELQNDRINISTAYELSGLNPADQKAAFDEYQESGEISIKAARDRKQDAPTQAAQAGPVNKPEPESLQPGCNNLETGLPPKEPPAAPQAHIQPPEAKRREETPPVTKKPAEGRTGQETNGITSPQQTPPEDEVENKWWLRSETDNYMEAVPDPADNFTRQLESLIDYCVSMKNTGDTSRNWSGCGDALLLALEKLEEGRAHE